MPLFSEKERKNAHCTNVSTFTETIEVEKILWICAKQTVFEIWRRTVPLICGWIWGWCKLGAYARVQSGAGRCNRGRCPAVWCSVI